MTIAFIFPGQGSQHIGMGKEFYDNFPVAREVFEEVDDALNQKLSHIILEGDEKELTMTANTQPALMATSMAAQIRRLVSIPRGTVRPRSSPIWGMW